MFPCSGYQVRELIHRSARYAIYRGVREADCLPVIVKSTAKEYPLLHELTKLKQEYEIASKLSMPGVVRCVALEKHGNGSALVMEDKNAISLQDFLDRSPMAPDIFLSFAIKLADTLSLVHDRGIIHKDIKPTNIVTTRDGSVIELIDFGAASLLSSEQQRMLASMAVEGTLTHISPEQTGRINRSIDQRSDLYSLGITFYEMLTGRLPFQSDDPLELLHCHLAQVPEPLSDVNPAVPEALSAIVLKLMAKTPEERYRSAGGLKSDLARCQEALKRGESIMLAVLGQVDRRGLFQIPQKLYGREVEVQLLLSVFSRAYAGSAEMLLVSGYSGIGKTSLVWEVHKAIVARRGNYVSGKFDQYKRNVPYASFVQAFQALVQQLLASDERRVREVRDKLLTALGVNSRLIIDLIPELSLVLGEQPEPPKLTGADAQRRFNETFRSFIRVFTTRDHPLVVFLDDLQWADTGTLSLIYLFMSDPEMQHFLLIGAYRDNEVSAHHPMCVMLEEARAAGAKMSEVVLKPLSTDDLEQLVADTLHREPKDVRPLAALIMEKTRGNPFFVCQLLRSLHQEELVWFDAVAEEWRCNLDAVRAKDITDNVVDLMAKRIQKLDAGTQSILKMASCIGSTFDLKTLSIVHSRSLKEAAGELWPALEESLVVPVNNAYKIPRIYDLDHLDDAQIRTLAESTSYKFLHDRVQQAAYSLIPEDELKSTHLRIGRLWLGGCRKKEQTTSPSPSPCALPASAFRARDTGSGSKKIFSDSLLESTSETELDESLFDIVGHFRAGIDRITDRAELYRVIELNISAARKATASSSFGVALGLLTTAIQRLPADSWRENYAVTLSCYLEASESECFNGHYVRALELLCQAESHVSDVLDRCRICELKVLVHKMMDDLDAAFEVGARMLSELGVELAQYPNEQVLQEELALTNAALGGRSVDDLMQSWEMSDPRKIAACGILQEMWSVGFFLGSLNMHVAAMKLVQISLRHGNTIESVFGYMVYAFAQVFYFNDIDEGYKLGRVSLKLYDRFQNRDVEAKILDMWGGLIQHYKEHLRACKETLWRGFVRGIEVADYQWSSYCSVNYTCMCIVGNNDANLHEVATTIDHFVTALRKYENGMTMAQLVAREAITNLMEEKADPTCIDGEYCQETLVDAYARENNSTNILFFMFSYKVYLSIVFDVQDNLLHLQAEMERASPFAAGIWHNLVSNFLQSMALLDVRHKVTSSEWSTHRQKIHCNLQKLEGWMARAPENFAHMVLLLQAELCSIDERYDRAIQLYDAAIQAAREQGAVWCQALAGERAARFFRHRGARTVAAAYLKDARHAYLFWGAHAKVRWIEARYPELVSTPVTQSDVNTTLKDVDLLAVMKASQAISGELVLSDLLKALMRTVVESAGAELGFLVLAREGGELFIEAAWPQHDDLEIPVSIERSDFVPKQILRYSALARAAVLLDDAVSGSQSAGFAGDEYIARKRSHSVLCLPILRSGRLTGLLYLENNLISSAFTPGKVRVLELLAAQAAISLENARLYDHVEQRVAERTRELSAARQVADAANQAKTDFLASMSHELRTPLNGILGYAQILERSHSLLPKDKDSVQIIRTSGEHLLTLINDVLDLAKIEAGKMDRVITAVDFASFMRRVVDLCKVGAEQKGLGFSYEQRGMAPRGIYTDEKRLLQVLLNLVSNAIKFTRQGRVVFRVEVLESGGADGDGGEYTVRFLVEDTGAGIVPEYLARIWKPFEQVGDVKARRAGTGLGLAISKRIIDHMGGSIEAHSQLGKGSVFAVTLRFAGAEIALEEAAPTWNQIVGYKGERRSVLVVDDNPENRALVRDLLMPIGVELYAVESGEQALRAATEHKPSLILMDLAMPGLDGYETTRRMRRMPELAQVMIIASSASISAVERQESARAGCNDFLSKPIRASELLEKLERHLGLEWLYVEGKESHAPPTVSKEGELGEPTPPSSEDLSILLNLMRRGRICDLLREVDRIEQTDARSARWVEKVRALASHFQLSQLRELLQSYDEATKHSVRS